jgi:hypothetical protein
LEGTLASIFKAAGPLEVVIRSVLAVGEELREIHLRLCKIPKQGSEAQYLEEAIERNMLEIRKGIRLLQLQLDAVGKLTRAKV